MFLRLSLACSYRVSVKAVFVGVSPRYLCRVSLKTIFAGVSAGCLCKCLCRLSVQVVSIAILEGFMHVFGMELSLNLIFWRVTSRLYFRSKWSLGHSRPFHLASLSDFLSEFLSHFLEINTWYIFTWHFQIKVADLFEVFQARCNSVGLQAQIKLKYIISVCPSVIMSVWVMPNESWGDRYEIKHD